ncbi:C-C motif chemokine 8-like [Nerophis lumbriciformis]|uniref:C-C motif chemokine 8-like n=1 Tax=Nerophis lumbriciformis TaxID=546530 RepID=UPI002ADF9686|nr:C-C motif chemokine 8-like [Nerophis lumbriciformis]
MRLGPVLLCLVPWMTSVLSAQRSASNCCPGLSNTIVPLKNILNYTVQPVGVCAIRAVVLYTRGRKRICADPNICWTQNAMLKVDGGVNTKSTSGSGTSPPCTRRKKGRKGRQRRRRQKTAKKIQ